MNILTFKHKRNDDPVNEKHGVEGWRWAFDISLSKWGFSIGFEQQVKFKGHEWREGGRYYLITITPHPSWGREHIYYDGPHDSFSLGFLHLTWSGDWCEKCYRDDK